MIKQNLNFGLPKVQDDLHVVFCGRNNAYLIQYLNQIQFHYIVLEKIKIKNKLILEVEVLIFPVVSEKCLSMQ